MTELLAPAGSVEALHSAINAGCDAVYIGGKMFGARAYADNPERDDLLGAIDHCHIFDKKIYLTVNTLLKNDELSDNLYSFLRPCYEEGLDGVIVSDPGVMKAISVLFPGLPIHISTQASVTGAGGARVLSRMVKGITRVVPARELSIDEIEHFKKNTDLEVEVFVHGAMCVCYSGQCLMSSLAGGRSGNRGRCAQPCRKNYDTGINDSFILSCKDMCTVPALGRLIRAGIDSLKIEGRMKSPIYVAATVEVYRKYLDIAYEQGENYEKYLSDHYSALEEDIGRLREIYNRGGFCTGFLLGEKELICSDKASHNGVLVGRVTGVSGREANISYSKEVNPGDVLEIRRNDGNTLYEYTSGSHYDVGSSYSVLVSKGHKASALERVFRVRNNHVINEINKKFIETSVKRKLKLSFSARSGSPLSLTIMPLGCDEKTAVTVCGACPEKAKTASASVENIKKHLCKTGDSRFEVSQSDIDIENGLFIPVGAINTLRREAIEVLEKKLINRSFRVHEKEEHGFLSFPSYGINIDRLCKETKNEEQDNNIVPGIFRSVLLSFEECLEPVLNDKSVDRIYLPLRSFRDKGSAIKRFESIADKLLSQGRELYISLPFICRENTSEEIKESGILNSLSDKCGFLIRNNEELGLFDKDKKYRTVLDHTLHIFNRVTADMYDMDFTYSPELNKDELREFGKKGCGELIVYGRLPLMQTAHCVYKNEGCECLKGRSRGDLSESYLKLKDEKGYVFPVIRRCAYCTNLILNSSVLDLRDTADDIKEIVPRSVRYEFTTETPDETERILRGERIEGTQYTFGHFKRGVL
ncbi:MAG: U32 family peptidase [Lachnospiraceae bacterium]|nr:U32 family peptidase [Lachnospiraceae bacterium]